MEKLSLGKEKIGKLLVAFSIPCIISMLINSVYNIVDQIFIGKGVGSLGNAATNVIFPIVIICNGIAQLIGNGCAANLSLLLGQGKKKEAKNMVGSSITMLVILSLLVCGLGELFLPKLVYLFGCTKNAYELSMIYGRIILAGAPFMIIYTGMAAIIRADGAPKYSMVCLLSGAIVNIILDPIFIFGLNLGVAGGAIATILGQLLSFIIAILYVFKMKAVKLELKDYKVDSSILRTLSYGLSSFVIQMTVLVLFILMNNVMTKYGAATKYGEDIPLSVYGVVSKLNSFYISFILGLAVGAQPIIGFNYGAGNIQRVKKTIKYVVTIALMIGVVFNVLLQVIPGQLVNLFATQSDPNYNLFIEFGIKCCRIFLMLCCLNALEMTCSIVFQSLGSVKKASFVSFLRQIILFLPLCLFMSSKMGLMGALYAAPIADSICFVIVLTLFIFEYKNIGKENHKEENALESTVVENNISKENVIVTISRQYGSGGRYVGRILAQKLGIKFWDKELIESVAKKSGMTEEFVSENEQKREWGANLNSEYNSEDELYIAQTKVIKEIATQGSCVIIGRCADYILKDNPSVIRVFIYSDEDAKIKRAIKHYNLNEKNAKKEIEKIDKERARHYKYYTNQEWGNLNNYDIALNSDYLGVEKTAQIIEEMILSKTK